MSQASKAYFTCKKCFEYLTASHRITSDIKQFDLFSVGASSEIDRVAVTPVLHRPPDESRIAFPCQVFPLGNIQLSVISFSGT